VFKELMLKHHPDKNPDADKEIQNAKMRLEKIKVKIMMIFNQIIRFGASKSRDPIFKTCSSA